MRWTLGVAMAAMLAAGGAAAQTFEETVAAAQAAVGDIARYQEALQNPDTTRMFTIDQKDVDG